MAEELLINVNPFETRVALVAHGLLQEIHVARAEGYSVTGNIYLGRVERIVPGMQAAFVNIGLHRPGFLHARDIDSPRVLLADDGSEREAAKADIRELLHDGQTILIQVEKDPISTKGARLSTQLALASKYLVLMPNETHVGISQRIQDEGERHRLRTLLSTVQGARETAVGVIARTAAESATELQLAT
ncbi:MAG: ribonuclease E/G, partial [Pseudomonadales bacterium]|nr:ribonuclease E/G [Pseudomonadales bacterium]